MKTTTEFFRPSPDPLLQTPTWTLRTPLLLPAIRTSAKLDSYFYFSFFLKHLQFSHWRRHQSCYLTRSWEGHVPSSLSSSLPYIPLSTASIVSTSQYWQQVLGQTQRRNPQQVLSTQIWTGSSPSSTRSPQIQKQTYLFQMIFFLGASIDKALTSRNLSQPNSLRILNTEFIKIGSWRFRIEHWNHHTLEGTFGAVFQLITFDY